MYTATNFNQSTINVEEVFFCFTSPNLISLHSSCVYRTICGHFSIRFVSFVVLFISGFQMQLFKTIFFRLFFSFFFGVSGFSFTFHCSQKKGKQFQYIRHLLPSSVLFLDSPYLYVLLCISF